MTALERVQAYLDACQPGLKVIELAEDTSTAELAARALGVGVGQIAKSLLFKARDGYIMVVAAGDVRMDAKELKKTAGSKVRMANAEEVLAVTGYPVGGVCPFALPRPVPVYLDESLKRYDVVYAAAGTPNSALPITFDQLRKITRGIPCRVSLDSKMD